MVALPFRDDDPRDDEVRSLFEQGWESFKRSQFALAQEQLETALALAERVESDELGGICLSLGKTMLARKSYSKAISYLERARNLYRANEIRDGEGWALALLAETYWYRRRRKRAKSLAIRALWLLRHEEAAYRSIGIEEASRQCFRSWQWRHAERLLLRNARSYESQGLSDHQIRALCDASFAALKRSRFAIARECLDRASELVDFVTPYERLRWIGEECRWRRKVESISSVATFLERQDVSKFDADYRVAIAFFKLVFGSTPTEWIPALFEILRAIKHTAAKP